MRLFVNFKVFDTITSASEINKLRGQFGEHVQTMMKSGKVETSGIFTDGRQGFFVLNVINPEEMWDLLGGVIVDHCHVETHPVSTFEKLGEFFRRHPAI